jgi:hypothetical protein
LIRQSAAGLVRYDNALAETINGPYKAELIQRRAPWKTRESESTANSPKEIEPNILVKTS